MSEKSRSCVLGKLFGLCRAPDFGVVAACKMLRSHRVDIVPERLEFKG